MTRNCSVCDHPQREAINSMLVAGSSSRDIAAAHGLNYQAIRRHRLNHLPQTIRAAAADALNRVDAAQTAPQVQVDATPARGLPEAVAAPVSAPEPIAPVSTVRRRTRALQLTDTPPASAADLPGSQNGTPADATAIPGAPAPAGVFNSYSEAVGLRDRAMNILELAERNGDAKTALTAIREARGVLEHLSRLEDRNQSNGPAVPLVDSPEWHRTRAAIIAALADHPEARLAVAEALIATGALN